MVASYPNKLEKLLDVACLCLMLATAGSFLRDNIYYGREGWNNLNENPPYTTFGLTVSTLAVGSFAYRREPKGPRKN